MYDQYTMALQQYHQHQQLNHDASKTTEEPVVDSH
jgi:hypothetical protein